MVEHLVAAALLDDPAVDHKHHLVGHLAGKAISWVTTTRVVPDRASFLIHIQHLAHQLRIQRRSGLIKQDHPRVQRQRPGNGDTLLLAAGEMPRPGVGFIAQSDDVQQFIGTGNGLFARDLLVGDRRLYQVLQHRQVRKQV
ncbi:Uncharacterised protein [Klebsiella pneumoniae]|uniref:Uncharacterized protein n=1 Tax=Klebsiella pneumoniae TaxID=573 RepID=A0A377WNB7_KLEPN|nr:Uncharacterised protein [Klebsiella pneumoniae]